MATHVLTLFFLMILFLFDCAVPCLLAPVKRALFVSFWYEGREMFFLSRSYCLQKYELLSEVQEVKVCYKT